jgi:AcrR family transcriptional regulator
MARLSRRTQAERSALSEQRIMRAATKLIGRNGYTKTTLAEIGREAGYTAGLVSHGFGS